MKSSGGLIFAGTMSDSSNIYLDYNSTTPVDDEVLREMLPYFKVKFANAASNTHLPGRDAASAVEEARLRIAQFLNCEPNEIIFTSGSTESINQSILGVAEIYKSKGNHIITWATEHKAVLETCLRLKEKGFEISILPVNRDGLPDLDIFKKCLTKETILVCAMMANNETGTIMPIREIAEIAHSHGALVFCDATQAPGKMRVDVQDAGADLMCISSHKMYGPKGCGALYLRRKNPRVKISPLIVGGGHENGLRSGTLNVPAIAGMGKAASLCVEKYWEDMTLLSEMRTLLEQMLTTNGRGYVNGSIKNRIPNTTNICFPGIKASELISKVPTLSMATGSACSSALPEPSHVLKAMGLSDADCYSSVRLSVGRITTREEIMTAARQLIDAIETLSNK